jgi:hypothetical protein
MEENGRGLLEVLSRHLLGGIEENRVKPQYVSRRSGRDSNRAPPKYETRELPLRQPARC